MKIKQILVLGVIFCVLALGVGIKQFLKPKELATEEYTPLRFSFDPSFVEKIHLGKGYETPIDLVKTEGVWRIPERWNVRANRAKIENFLENIRTAKGELRADDRNLARDFGLESSEAFYVSLFDALGGPLFKVWIGTKKSVFRFPFVRVEGSDRIYLSEMDFFDALGLYADPKKQRPTADPWLALDLFDLKMDEIQGIEIRRFEKKEAGTVLAVNRRKADPSTWEYAKDMVPFLMDQVKIREYLTELVSLRATTLLEPGSKKSTD